MTSGIYRIRNENSGCCYIGSAVDIERRWKHHRSRLTHGKHHARYLQRAYKKYGAGVFVFEIVEVCDVSDESVRVARETHWMRSTPSAYNSAPAAASTLGLRFKLSQSTKDKISAAIKGRKQSPDWVAKRIAKTAESLRGKKLSPETCEKLSRAKKGKPHSAEWAGKIADALRGKKRTAEQKANIAAGVRASYERRKSAA